MKDTVLNNNQQWEELSQTSKSLFVDKEEYIKCVLDYLIKNQMPHNMMLKLSHSKYYQNMYNYGIENKLVYPYHLGPFLSQDCYVSPFNYYRNMVIKCIVSGKSVSSIPPLTWSDISMTLGLNSQTYVHILSQTQSSKFYSIFKSKESQVGALFPTIPDIIVYQKGWMVQGIFSNNESDMNNDIYSKICLSQNKRMNSCEIDEKSSTDLYISNRIFFYPNIDPDDSFVLSNIDCLLGHSLNFDTFESKCFMILRYLVQMSPFKKIGEDLGIEQEDVFAYVSFLYRIGCIDKYDVLCTGIGIIASDDCLNDSDLLSDLTELTPDVQFLPKDPIDQLYFSRHFACFICLQGVSVSIRKPIFGAIEDTPWWVVYISTVFSSVPAYVIPKGFFLRALFPLALKHASIRITEWNGKQYEFPIEDALFEINARAPSSALLVQFTQPRGFKKYEKMLPNESTRIEDTLKLSRCFGVVHGYINEKLDILIESIFLGLPSTSERKLITTLIKEKRMLENLDLTLMWEEQEAIRESIKLLISQFSGSAEPTKCLQILYKKIECF